MKICSLIFCFITFESVIATAAPTSYLDLTTIQKDQILTAVKGNGMEKGFIFHFSLWEQNLNHIAKPKIVIPATNNHADCQFKKITTNFSHPVGQSALSGWVDFQIEVSTSVGGDTGGCLLFVYQHGGFNAEIVKIISYEYTIN